MNKTIQREAILKVLKNGIAHPSAEDVYISLKKRLPQLSLATVYRNLEQMAINGTVKKISFNDKPARFDIDTRRHFHIFCPVCGAVSNIDFADFAAVNEQINQKLSDLKIDDYCLYFIHICDACRQELNDAEPPPKPKVLSMLD